jgi:hypothetical protein
MGFPSRAKCRHLHLLVAITAAIGLEFDVVCNPYAPTIILHWLTSHVDSPLSAANDSGPSAPSEIADTGVEMGKTGPDHGQAGPPEAPARFSVTPEIAEVIAVRPRPRSSFFVLTGAFYSVSLPWLKPAIDGRKPGDFVPAHNSIQSRLCRLRC